MFSVFYSDASTAPFPVDHLILGECKSSNGILRQVHPQKLLGNPKLRRPGTRVGITCHAHLETYLSSAIKVSLDSVLLIRLC